jgi:hypothetical protein
VDFCIVDFELEDQILSQASGTAGQFFVERKQLQVRYNQAENQLQQGFV